MYQILLCYTAECNTCKILPSREVTVPISFSILLQEHKIKMFPFVFQLRAIRILKENLL